MKLLLAWRNCYLPLTIFMDADIFLYMRTLHTLHSDLYFRNSKYITIDTILHTICNYQSIFIQNSLVNIQVYFWTEKRTRKLGPFRIACQVFISETSNEQDRKKSVISVNDSIIDDNITFGIQCSVIATVSRMYGWQAVWLHQQQWAQAGTIRPTYYI